MRAMHYRHAYHAGNFADVWKHAIVFGILDALNRKATPWSYVESHAGAGHYLLSGEAASKTEEWRDGIGRLRAASGAPELAARFLATTSRIGTGRYPGSPWFALEMARSEDQLLLCEAVPDVARTLMQTCGKRATVQQRDGYRMDALLPPRHKRGLVLIDPPFERADEFRAVAELLERCASRFGHGVHALWYPRKNAHDADRALRRMARAFGKPVWNAVLDHGDVGGGRMHACGVAVVNPPYGLDTQWAESLAWMASQLGRGARAHHRLEWINP